MFMLFQLFENQINMPVVNVGGSSTNGSIYHKLKNKDKQLQSVNLSKVVFVILYCVKQFKIFCFYLLDCHCRKTMIP